jgi:hypothetical protein
MTLYDLIDELVEETGLSKLKVFSASHNIDLHIFLDGRCLEPEVEVIERKEDNVSWVVDLTPTRRIHF